MENTSSICNRKTVIGRKEETIMKTGTEKVVFLDRDGTMNVEVNYLHRPEELELIEGTAEAVRLLNEAGYKVIVVTNQAGVARGYYKEADVDALHEYLNVVLSRDGAHVDAFYYCPHHPEHGIGEYKKNCACRKPGTGMLEQAERDLPDGIDKAGSYMIGDKILDTEAGRRFGVTGILVGTGYGAELYEKALKEETVLSRGQNKGTLKDGPGFDYYEKDLLTAVRAILAGKYR